MNGQLIKIEILTSKNFPINARTILAPFIIQRHLFRESGINFKFHHGRHPSKFGGDLLIVESSFHGIAWTCETERIIQEFKNWRKFFTNVVYLDSSDSSALLHPEILPFVDGYLKGQILKDKSQYLNAHYGRRLFTDYANKHFDVSDNEPIFSTAVQNPKDLKKIAVLWNSAFYDWSKKGRVLDKLTSILGSRAFIRMPTPQSISIKEKSKKISYRMQLEYGRNTINWQRTEPLKLLMNEVKTFGLIESGRIGFWQYRREMSTSQIVVSPFGWGEINYRDFETFQSGCVLVKPSMHHLETWPNLYKPGETCLSYDWDLSNFIPILKQFLDDKDELERIAMQGQTCYANYTSSEGWQDSILCQFQFALQSIGVQP